MMHWGRHVAFLTAERLLSWSLGIVYLWFGVLKILGLSPVVELIRQTYEPLAAVPLYCGLAVFEVVVGMALLMGWWKPRTAPAVVFHLLGTFGILVFTPKTAFLPYFPFLTMQGEFVIKNIVLLAAGASLWLMQKRPLAARPSLIWALVMFSMLFAGLGLAGLHLNQSVRSAPEDLVKSGNATPIRLTAAGIRSFLQEQTKPLLLVEGKVEDRCRLLGCWIIVRDSTGKLFVDLAPSGLSARRIPEGSEIQVLGSIAKTREGKIGFVASTVRTNEFANTGGSP